MFKRRNKKRFGKVVINLSYVVDLNNEAMVKEAKESLYEDVMNFVKYDELHNHIGIIPGNNLKESDIPDFLKEMTE